MPWERDATTGLGGGLLRGCIARRLNRRRARWRCAAATANIVRPPERVLFPRRVRVRRLRRVVRCLTGLLLEQPFEIAAAPTAARPRAEAIAKLSDSLGPLDAQIVYELPLRNVKAQTDFIVEFHVISSGTMVKVPCTGHNQRATRTLVQSDRCSPPRVGRTSSPFHVGLAYQIDLVNALVQSRRARNRLARDCEACCRLQFVGAVSFNN